MISVKANGIAIIIAILVFSEASTLEAACPLPAKIEPCTCYEDNEINKTRSNLLCLNLNQSNFIRVLSELRGYEFNKITIIKSILDSIDQGMFIHVQVKQLRIDVSLIKTFSMRGLRPIGLKLKEIHFNSLRVERWIFASNVRLNALRRFTMEHCGLNYWRNDTTIFNYLPETLPEIYLERCNVNSKGMPSFKRYFLLERLSLSGNRIRYVQRSDLPMPSHYLRYYNLNYNPIASLPTDMFQEMPNLAVVELHNTLLATLQYDTFKPVLDHLESLQIWNLPLTCDCSAVWLLDYMKLLKKNYPVLCRRPITMERVNIDSLRKSDMCPTLISISQDRQNARCAKCVHL